MTKRVLKRKALPDIHYATIPLLDGRYVQLFVNRDTNLVVLDIVDADEQGGVEVYRRHHPCSPSA